MVLRVDNTVVRFVEFDVNFHHFFTAVDGYVVDMGRVTVIIVRALGLGVDSTSTGAFTIAATDSNTTATSRLDA